MYMEKKMLEQFKTNLWINQNLLILRLLKITLEMFLTLNQAFPFSGVKIAVKALNKGL